MPYWLFTIVGFSLLGGLLFSLYNKNWNYMFISLAFFLGLFALYGMPMLNVTADSPHYNTERHTENTMIYSLRTSDSVGCDFILGNGSVNGETYYVYYTQDGDGAYSMNKVDAAKCKIYMDRDSGGVLTKVWGTVDDENFAKHWGWPRTIFSHYEFHLPYGSLVREYSVR